MSNLDHQEKILDSIYAAAGDQTRWKEMLLGLAQQMDATAATIIQLENWKGHLEVSIGAAEDAKLLYDTHYGALDSWTHASRGKVFEGWVWAGEELVPAAELAKSEFYADFLRHFSMFHEAGTCLQKQGSFLAVLSVLRDRCQPAFDGEAAIFLGMVSPHLRRGLQLHRKMLDLQEKNDTLSAAFDAVLTGVVLLGSSGTVLAVNRAASEICANSKCLQLSPTAIRATESKADRALQRTIALAKDPRLGNSGGGVIRINRESGEPLVVVVSPIRTGDWPVGTSVGVFITDPDFHQSSTPQILQAAFGLTPAETRLASVLAQGFSLAEASEQLHVSLNTVRTQLKNLFAKTNTSRQAQLAALLSKLPRVG